MKRGTLDHWKAENLARELHLPRWGVAGLLESIWHFAAGYALQGDIGRASNADVARVIGWEGDPDVLIEALVRTRWLDRCSCHRLRVHDWPDHADKGLRRALLNRRLAFLACYSAPELSGSPESSSGAPESSFGRPAVAVAAAAASALATPQPEPPPQPPGGDEPPAAAEVAGDPPGEPDDVLAELTRLLREIVTASGRPPTDVLIEASTTSRNGSAVTDLAGCARIARSNPGWLRVTRDTLLRMRRELMEARASPPASNAARARDRSDLVMIQAGIEARRRKHGGGVGDGVDEGHGGAGGVPTSAGRDGGAKGDPRRGLPGGARPPDG